MLRHLQNLWFMCRSRHYRKSQLEIYSLWSIVLNLRRLRSDYVEFTAKRYAENVRDALAKGFQPLDFRHTKEEFWVEELRKM